ncbi:transposase [Komagataeibacter saccharivorans]|uniref:transposase n=1 Tax=Komagataeibacter saccharivorans TaxID=265959 RepID=UPI0039E88A55
MSYESTSPQPSGTCQPKTLSGAFRCGYPARSTAEIIGVNRNTATLSCSKSRQIIVGHNALETPLEGKVEVDESYFGGHRKGKRGRGVAGKVAVFQLLQRADAPIP